MEIKKAFRALNIISIRVLGAGAAFALNVFIARQLPQDQAGLFYLAIAFVSVLSSIGMFGMNTAVLRFISPAASSGDWPSVNGIFVRAGTISACLLGAFSLFTFLMSAPIAALFHKPQLSQVLSAVSPGIFFVGASIFVSHCLAARLETSKSILVLSVGIPIGALLLVLVFKTRSAVSAGLLYSVSSSVTLALGLAWWITGLPNRKIATFQTRKILSSGAALWMVTVMGQAVQWSSQFVAGYWLQAGELAEFSVAQRTAMLISFALIAVNMIVAPLYATTYAQGKIEDLERLVRKVMLCTAAVSAPPLAFLCLFPHVVLEIFGSQFTSASTCLVIMSLGQFLNLVLGSAGYLLTVTGHEKALRNLVFVSGPSAVILSVLLVPKFGAIGASVAVALSVAMQSILTIIAVKKSIGLNLFGLR